MLDDSGNVVDTSVEHGAISAFDAVASEFVADTGYFYFIGIESDFGPRFEDEGEFAFEEHVSWSF